MAQAFYCPACQAAFGAELRGKSCPACGDELIHGRIPSGRSVRRTASNSTGRAVWDHIIKRDPCAYCGVKLKPREITIDHIQPKALGGSKGSWTNRAGACRPCNADKAHTPLLFFMLEQVGVDISFLKEEDGDWPIPEEEKRLEALEEENKRHLKHEADSRKLLSAIKAGHFPAPTHECDGDCEACVASVA